MSNIIKSIIYSVIGWCRVNGDMPTGTAFGETNNKIDGRRRGRLEIPDWSFELATLVYSSQF